MMMVQQRVVARAVVLIARDVEIVVAVVDANDASIVTASAVVAVVSVAIQVRTADTSVIGVVVAAAFTATERASASTRSQQQQPVVLMRRLRMAAPPPLQVDAIEEVLASRTRKPTLEKRAIQIRAWSTMKRRQIRRTVAALLVLVAM
jgi:hypothetical protein